MPQKPYKTSMATNSQTKSSIQKANPPMHLMKMSSVSLYINKVKSLRGYISLLTACKKAKEVGEVVATMCQNEEAIDADLIAKKDFIHLLLPFLTNVKTGKGVDNLRLYINNAWDARKKAIRQSNR